MSDKIPIIERPKEVKITKAELKRRIDIVKKVLIQLYKRRRNEYTSLIPTTARNELNQASLKDFLNNPENRGLVDRIYELSRGGARSADDTSYSIDPATIPTLFGIREQEDPRERQKRVAEQLAEARKRKTIKKEEQYKKELESKVARAQESDEQLAELERMVLGRMTEIQTMEEEEAEKAKKAREEEEAEKAKKAREEEEYQVKKQQAELQAQQELERLKAEAERVRQYEEEEGLKEIEESYKQALEKEKAQAEAQKRKQQRRPRAIKGAPKLPKKPSYRTKKRKEEAIKEEETRKEEEARKPGRTREAILEAIASTYDRITGRLYGVSTPKSQEQQSSNVPADPVENQRQEAQQGVKLPQTPAMPKIPEKPSQPIQLPKLTEENRNAILNNVPLPQRQIVNDVIQGRVDPSTLTNDVIKLIVQGMGFNPLIGPAVKIVFDYINKRIGKTRYAQILKDVANERRGINLTPEQRQKEAEREAERAEREEEYIYDLDALEVFRNIGTPADILTQINAATANEREYNQVAQRQFIEISERVLSDTLLNNIDPLYGVNYLNDLRYAIVNSNPGLYIDPITQDSFSNALELREKQAKSIQAEEQRQQLIKGTARGVQGAIAGGIAGASSSALSGGMRGVAGRIQGGIGSGAAFGAVGAAAGGEIGERVGGERGGRVGTIAGGVIGGLVSGVKLGSSLSKVQEVPVDIPDQVVSQEEPLKSGSGKGTLRPKFIIPSASILDKTPNEIQADLDEFSAFDYVIPTSEGTEGNINNNALKRQAYIQEELILNGGGVNIPSQWGEEPMINEQEQKEQMIGDKLSPIPELEMGVIDEDISVGFYTEKVQPNLWEAGSIKLDKFYKEFTRTTDLNDNIIKSSLYGLQY